MRTILVTGSDTGIGKTRVAAAIGRLLWQPGERVQFIKVIETGREANAPGDADIAAEASGIDDPARFTLVQFAAPLAPLAAARHALAGAASVGRQRAPAGSQPEPLSFSGLLQRWRALPPADLRIVEGAGGIAVPLDPDGRDWRDLAEAIGADRVVLVTPDRLGGINQARLTWAYARQRNLPAGIWLNEHEPQPEEIRRSNRTGIAGLPLWATQRFEAPLPEDPEAAKTALTAAQTDEGAS